MKDSRTSFGFTSEKLIEKDQFRVDLWDISMSDDTESKDFWKVCFNPWGISFFAPLGHPWPFKRPFTFSSIADDSDKIF